MSATLSRPVLTGLLREELGFNGLIVTDSLEMGALSANGYPPPIGAPLALAAGADLLLFNRDHAMHRESIANLVAAVRDGKIPEKQVDASVQRVLEAKERFGLLNPAPVNVASALSSVKTAEHLALAAELAQKAITILKDDAALLPLQPGEPLLVIETAAAEGLGALLHATTLGIKNDPDTNAIASALGMARDGRKVVVTTTDAAFYPGQIKLVTELLAKNPRVILVSVRSPYDIHVLPKIPTYLASYGSNPPTLRALAAALTSKFVPSGILPVTFP
jgi:beta-N-acetylhexosaminidase